MSSKSMSSKGFCWVLASVLGASMLSGCRSNKPAFSYASPQPSELAIASVGPPAPTQLAQEVQPTAATAGLPPASSSYTPSYSAPSYSSPPSKSSAGCSSGCCGG